MINMMVCSSRDGFNRFRKQKEGAAVATGFNLILSRAKTDYNQICGLSRLSTKVHARLLGFVNKIGAQAFIHATYPHNFYHKACLDIFGDMLHCRLLLIPFPLLRIQKQKISNICDLCGILALARYLGVPLSNSLSG